MAAQQEEQQQQEQQQEHIDRLLQRYLDLLDQYTKLRAQLSTLLARVYRDLARANFSAERGMRYGESHYDGRMRATRLLSLNEDAGQPVIVIARPGDGEQPTPCKDPLRWFGMSVPTALRTAQSQSVEAVERIIPALVSVQAEMLAVEIEVRRARKRRDRAPVSSKDDVQQAETVEAG
ncbi:hypothetical protein L249_7956 [Ophiocordyceps polyrhachis-furcata BCC 54312]|uniref:Vacuolar ATPase assembly protein VMA22 n=1 Tax=Ophiocordyceps polyrhachis-furcata BCC 54312 TaxID=1330021 RepID=A0A367LH20_9HYPO|nr:hypothetical protein L249_7956 [Ophiocordyceps polyrhachis-furcata BCC 54312]